MKLIHKIYPQGLECLPPRVWAPERNFHHLTRASVCEYANRRPAACWDNKCTVTYEEGPDLEWPTDVQRHDSSRLQS